MGASATAPLASRSCSITKLLAEDSGGPEDEDEGQHEEHEELRPARVAERRREVLDEPDDEAAEGRPVDVADAPEDRRCEGLQAGVEAEVLANVAEPEAPDDPRRTRERAAESECQCDRLV